MKTKNVNNAVIVNKEERVTSITTTFAIPFMDWKGDYREKAGMTWDDVVHKFSGVIVKALEDRMAACMNMLSKNIFKVVYSDEYVIIFEKENGNYHTFNHASYRVMEEAVTIFNMNTIFGLKLEHFDQIMKALVWVEDRKDIEGISFGNLVSCIMELTIGKAQAYDTNI